MEIIRKRRFSDPKAPVQIVNDIKVAAPPHPMGLGGAILELKAMQLKPQAKNPNQYGRPFQCIAQECSGFAPTDAEVGARSVPFPVAESDSSTEKMVGDWWEERSRINAFRFPKRRRRIFGVETRGIVQVFHLGVIMPGI
jgi:hypothetical protein